MSEEKEEIVDFTTAELKSPKEWAEATGNGPKRGKSTFASAGTSQPRGSVAHEVAKILHGWPEHEHHTGAPIK